MRQNPSPPSGDWGSYQALPLRATLFLIGVESGEEAKNGTNKGEERVDNCGDLLKHCCFFLLVSSQSTWRAWFVEISSPEALNISKGDRVVKFYTRYLFVIFS